MKAKTKHKSKKNARVPQPKCPYCGKNAILTKASSIYHTDRNDNEYLYVCSGYPECNAYVSVHSGTHIPKGSLANGDLRHKRIKTHRIFDMIWQSGIMSKKQAYKWMQDIFFLREDQAHIAMFDEFTCDRLIAECEKFLANNHISYRRKVG